VPLRNFYFKTNFASNIEFQRASKIGERTSECKRKQGFVATIRCFTKINLALSELNNLV